MNGWKQNVTVVRDNDKETQRVESFYKMAQGLVAFITLKIDFLMGQTGEF